MIKLLDVMKHVDPCDRPCWKYRGKKIVRLLKSRERGYVLMQVEKSMKENRLLLDKVDGF